MCRETMDGTSELTKIDYLRQNAKFGSELKWKFVRVSTDENEAFKRCRATRLTNRKRTRREPKRRELARLAKLYEVTGKKDEKESAIKGKDSAACTQRPPAGAMAPENTTQYLMSNVYDDVETEYHRSDKTWAHIYSEYLSPSNVYAALDSGYESCLEFQQRDFEEVFNLTWQPE